MKSLIALLLVAFTAGISAQCVCNTMKWAVCDGTPCQCTLQMADNVRQALNCSSLIPKCYLMKTETYRARRNQSTRSGGKPVESAFVDNDGIYDPVCEASGLFKAKQCNNTNKCWCVNSAGVRRTDKSDNSLVCDELVETYWVRVQLQHKAVTSPVNATTLNTAMKNIMTSRYQVDKSFVKAVDYYVDRRLILVDLEKPKGNRNVDLARAAYYMEKDVKVLPLFRDQNMFAAEVNGQTLEMENVLVYYVDEKPPTFTMKHLTGGVIAVIVVVILAVVAGLVIVYLHGRNKQK